MSTNLAAVPTGSAFDPCCCGAVDCPVPSYTCESYSAAKNKLDPCGYPEWTDPSDPPKFYLTLTETYHFEFTVDVHFLDDSEDGTTTCDQVGSITLDAVRITTRYRDEEGVCQQAPSGGWDGSGSITGSLVENDTLDPYSAEDPFHYECSEDTPLTGADVPTLAVDCEAPNAIAESTCFYNGLFCVPLGSPDTPIDSPVLNQTEKSCSHEGITPVLAGAGASGDGVHEVVSGSSILSDEETLETTEELITRTTESLPETTNGSTCSAYRNLSDDESSFSIRKFRVKFTFTPPNDGRGYEIDWIERFTPEGGGSPTDTPQTFVWTGGSPGVEQDSGWVDIAVPTTDGTTTIAEVTWLCPEP